jgi:hypothetical protein
MVTHSIFRRFGVRYCRELRCARCGVEIGSYPVFSSYEDEDTGEPEFSEEYGGVIDEEDYCCDCFEGLSVAVLECESQEL